MYKLEKLGYTKDGTLFRASRQSILGEGKKWDNSLEIWWNGAVLRWSPGQPLPAWPPKFPRDMKNAVRYHVEKWNKINTASKEMY